MSLPASLQYEWHASVKMRQQTGGMVALLVRHRTCDSQVAGSSPSSSLLRSGCGQATYTCVPLSPSSIIWYRRKLVRKLPLKLWPYGGIEMCILLLLRAKQLSPHYYTAPSVLEVCSAHLATMVPGNVLIIPSPTQDSIYLTKTQRQKLTQVLQPELPWTCDETIFQQHQKQCDESPMTGLVV